MSPDLSFHLVPERHRFLSKTQDDFRDQPSRLRRRVGDYKLRNGNDLQQVFEARWPGAVMPSAAYACRERFACGGRLRTYSPLSRNSANFANRSSHSTSSSARRAECGSAATLVAVRPSSTCSLETMPRTAGRMVNTLFMGALCCADGVHRSNVTRAEKFPTDMTIRSEHRVFF